MLGYATVPPLDSGLRRNDDWWGRIPDFVGKGNGLKAGILRRSSGQALDSSLRSAAFRMTERGALPSRERWKCAGTALVLYVEVFDFQGVGLDEVLARGDHVSH